ncbi:ECF transporter S component [Amedibacillus sp. YH-ame10]
MKTTTFSTKELVVYALGMAVVFSVTMYIKIPNGIDGYFNLGDGFILLFSSILGPIGGFFIGGLGSALADVAGGYSYYFFFTLIIKGLEGFLVGWLFQKYGNRVRFIAYLLGSIIMVSGYFLAKWYLKGNLWIAVSGIVENIIQSAFGCVIALVALPVVQKHVATSRIYKQVLHEVTK